MVFRWNDWNIEHVAAHGVSPQGAEAGGWGASVDGEREKAVSSREEEWEMRGKMSRVAAHAAEFDREFIADSFKAPRSEATAQWRRARRKRGRPRQGRGVKVISVSVEKSLLRRCDALAKKMGVTRASLVARGLRKMLSVA